MESRHAVSYLPLDQAQQGLDAVEASMDSSKLFLKLLSCASPMYLSIRFVPKREAQRGPSILHQDIPAAQKGRVCSLNFASYPIVQ